MVERVSESRGATWAQPFIHKDLMPSPPLPNPDKSAIRIRQSDTVPYPLPLFQRESGGWIETGALRLNDDGGNLTPRSVMVDGGAVWLGDPVAGSEASSSQGIVRAFLLVCPGDFTSDGQVAGADLAALLAAWGQSSEVVDLNGDGAVDGADLAVLLASWGSCP